MPAHKIDLIHLEPGQAQGLLLPAFMKVLKIQLNPWEKILALPGENSNWAIDDYVIVKTEAGQEMGRVAGEEEVDDNSQELKDKVKTVIRKANSSDLEKIRENNKQRGEAMSACRKIIESRGAPMKLVDAHFSFDGGRITFAFTADTRVDFRDLVKDLTRNFQKSIRLHQLGIRDEAKILGDIGSCGRPLCCRKFLKELQSITSDFADIQQIGQRGSDRLSGACGRLMCCLAYEEKTYRELAGKLPAIGSEIKTEQGKGKVIRHHILKQTVDVVINEDMIIEVPV